MSVRFSTFLDESSTLIATVVIESEPDYIVGFNYSGGITEYSRVMLGDWIVICAAAWDSKDHDALEIAVECVKRFKGKYKLGIIPFNDAVELRPFASRFMSGFYELTAYTEIKCNLTVNDLDSTLKIESSGFTPYWIFLRFGVVNHLHQGPLTDDELMLAIKTFLPLKD